MIRYVFLAFFAFTSLFGMVRTSVEVPADPDGVYYSEYYGPYPRYYYYDDWYGPGYYNGIWFGTEVQFNNWHGRGYHHYHHYHGGGGHGGHARHGGGGHGGGHHH